MPTYDFYCTQCGSFELMLKISHRNEPQSCPECGGGAVRQILYAPQLVDMPIERRQAMQINERSAHEPKLKSHGSGCSCCSTSTSEKAPKAFANKRPWMISH
ncbi:zinc ribbon domain protein [Ferrovum sp. JA12]|uniref:FmdB family zinc ribbon protein n=1 Tax=Ferrovum sp. JA12 TaxID=1356299 RepID=UPI000702B538|nr:zinc ribbon domain-containing protein [Ferrovum sp. JA12]KRH78222.1 zinc ribbon domain protein [Ferrovum sp. JA12]